MPTTRVLAHPSAKVLALLLFAACADPVESPDAGPDAGPDATVRTDASPAADAAARDAAPDAEVRDGAEELDAGMGEDAAVDPDSGTNPCAPNGRQHIMFGSAQNPQMITFGAGLPNERTVEIDGAYLASFDSGGCFEWLARMPAQQGSFGGPNMIIDPQGNVFFAIALNGDIQFFGSDDVLAHEISTMAGAPAEPYRRGAAIISYDRQGNFRWVKRIGNADVEPAGKGYSVASLELTQGILRMAGSVNGATRGPPEDYDVVFGLGEPNETRVTIGQRFQFGYVAAFDPSDGSLVAGSVRIDAPQVGATSSDVRHNGRGTGQAAADGSYVLGLLFVGSPQSYLLNRGQMDESTVALTANFVAGFTKRAADGTLTWHRFAGAASGGLSVFSSATLSDGSALFSGSSPALVDFEGSAATTLLADGASAYLVRYDAAGDVAWLRGIVGRGLSHLFADEARGALFAIGNGIGDTTFGVGDMDAITETIAGPFVARFDLATGALTWVAKVDAASAAFRDLDIIGGELILSARVDDDATFAPGTPQQTAVGDRINIWSGNARYDVETGTLLGLTEYVRHRGTRLNDGLNLGGVHQP